MLTTAVVVVVIVLVFLECRKKSRPLTGAYHLTKNVTTEGNLRKEGKPSCCLFVCMVVGWFMLVRSFVSSYVVVVVFFFFLVVVVVEPDRF